MLLYLKKWVIFARPESVLCLSIYSSMALLFVDNTPLFVGNILQLRQEAVMSQRAEYRLPHTRRVSALSDRGIVCFQTIVKCGQMRLHCRLTPKCLLYFRIAGRSNNYSSLSADPSTPGGPLYGFRNKRRSTEANAFLLAMGSILSASLWDC